MSLRFPYEKFRIGQRESITFIEKAVREGKIISLSAPTGFGKTIVSLLGCLNGGADKILYVVRTKNEITPVLREASKLNLSFTFLMSKRDTCPLVDGHVSIEDFWENCKVLREEGKCPYYLNVQNISVTQVNRKFKEYAPYTIKIIKYLQEINTCTYYVLRELIGSSELVVATYPYLFTDFIFEYTFSPYTYSDFTVVVDEAHSLAYLSDLFERKLSLRRLELIKKEILKYTPYASDFVSKIEFIEELLLNATIKEGMYTFYDKNVLLRNVGDIELWYDLAKEIRLEKFKEVTDKSKVTIKVHTLSLVNFIGLLSLDNMYLFTYGRSKDRYFVIKTVDPSVIVSRPLEDSHSVILMSGTMPPVDFLKNVLSIERNIEELDVERQYGPIFPEENRVVLVVTDVTSKYERRNVEMYKKYALYIDTALEILRDDVKLVVYPSYEFMEQILKHVNVKGFVEDRKTRIYDVVEYVNENRNTVIHSIAGGKLSEGVELVKNGRSLVKAVLIAGIPYPQADDYTKMYFEHLASKVGEELSWNYVHRVPAMVKVRQAIGRAIRSENDKAVFILLDYRFMDRRLQSLLKLKYNKIIKDIIEYRRVLKILYEEFL